MKLLHSSIITRGLCVVLLSLSSLFCVANPWFQDGNVITGRVTDNEGNSLPAASVKIKGTTNAVASNQTGNYSFSNIQPGKYTIVVTYMGFETKESEVEVAAGKTATLNFALEVGKTGLRSVIVTASREGQAKALNQQRMADNIKQVISADLMGRFPDLNVAEALQRLPGVTIGRNKGEGATIQLRGTPGGFTNININGEQIMGTSETGERNASLDGYSVDVLSSMEVVKTLTPDLDGDAIAGIVNLKTPIAAGLKPRFSADAGLGYNNLRGELNGIGNLSYGQRFFADDKNQNGKLGVIVTGSYYQTRNGYDAMQAEVWQKVPFGVNGVDSVFFPTDVRFIYYDAKRTRKGLSGTLDYQFSPTTSIVANVMYNNLVDEQTRYRKRTRMRADDNRLVVQPDGTFFHPRGRAYNEAKEQEENTQNINYSLEGETKIGRVKLDAGVFFTQSEFENSAASYNFYTTANNNQLSLKNINDEYPLMYGADWKYKNSIYFFNPANGMEADYFTTKGTNLAARFNVTVPYKLGEYDAQFKVGVKVKSMHNKRFRPDAYGSWDYVGTPAAGNLNNFVTGNVSDELLDGNVDFGDGVDLGKAAAFFNANKGTNFVRNERVSRMSTDSYFYDATEDIIAGYMMNRVQIDNITVIGGLRVERTKVDYDGNVVELDPVDDGWKSTTPVNKTNSYTKFLPNLQVKADLNSTTVVRAAMTFGYSRPTFTDLVPGRIITILNASVTDGNPELSPAFSSNFDLIFEKYLKNLGILSAGAFYKKIDKFQYRSTTTLVGDEFEGAASYAGYRWNRTLNGNMAQVYGLEFNAQSNLTFLPGILKGIGIMANYTWAYSNADAQERKGLRLPGQAVNTANGSLSFAYKGFSIQGNVNFNDDYTLILGSDGDRDAIRDSRVQIDANTSYRINKHFTVYAEAMNLTNAAQRTYFGEENRIYGKQYYGTWGRMGVKFRL